MILSEILFRSPTNSKKKLKKLDDFQPRKTIHFSGDLTPFCGNANILS
jgi:hypothetical protein